MSPSATTVSERDETTPALFAIVGATGTGKSDLSLDLADALASRGTAAEVVNADAMQLYRGMDIGTAKVPVGERRGIPHHLFDVLDVTEDAAVARYQQDARAAIEDIHARGRHAILVGGSGLYVSSVLFDFRFPPRDEALRADWRPSSRTTAPARCTPGSSGRTRPPRPASIRRTAGGSSVPSRSSPWDTRPTAPRCPTSRCRGAPRP